LNGRSKKI